jgi:hypothetical protein
MHDIQSQMPEAICQSNPGSVNTNLIINRSAPPFDNPDLRRAMALGLDRKAFIDILTEGQGNLGGVLQPPPAAYGVCRWMFCRRCPAMEPMCRRTGRKRASLCRNSATNRTTGSKSRCRRAIFRPIEILP